MSGVHDRDISLMTGVLNEYLKYVATELYIKYNDDDKWYSNERLLQMFDHFLSVYNDVAEFAVRFGVKIWQSNVDEHGHIDRQRENQLNYYSTKFKLSRKALENVIKEGMDAQTVKMAVVDLVTDWLIEDPSNDLIEILGMLAKDSSSEY
jgi:hypothetical protein